MRPMRVQKNVPARAERVDMFALIELAFIVLVGVFVVTQFVVPAMRDTPVLPMFRRRKLVKKLTEAHGAVEDAELRREIMEENKRAAKIAGRK